MSDKSNEASLRAIAQAQEINARNKGWQPIETAPKTMKDIMSLYGNGYEYRVLIGRKDEPTENPHAVLLGCVSVAELIDGKWMSINDDEMAECFGRYSEIIEPTHWMPLPEPPK